MKHADILIYIGPKKHNGKYPVTAWLDDGSVYQDGELALNDENLRANFLDPFRYGTELFNALFSGEIQQAYERLVGRAERESEGRIRVRLWIDSKAIELHHLPWERIYNSQRDHQVALATSTLTPFSRFTAVKLAKPVPISKRPIRLFFAIANPTGLKAGFQPVNVEEEVRTIIRSLKNFQREGQIQVSLLPGRTGLSSDLRRLADRERFVIKDGSSTLDNILRWLPGNHIFHFLGHGEYDPKSDPETGELALLLEKNDGTMDPVKDSVVVDGLVKLDPQPHLIFLSACESAKIKVDVPHPFMSLGPQLVNNGIPAVIAMQDKIPMKMASQMTPDFYQQLLEHGLVDRALNQARLLLFDHEEIEWSIPVLFMRLTDGRLFVKPRKRVSSKMQLKAPPPPDTFAGRTEEIRMLQDLLVSPEQLSVSVALQGMGGVGKSTLAQMIGRELGWFFPNGVLWLEMGLGADKDTLLDRLSLILGLEIKEEPKIEKRAATIRNHLTQRGRMLVILDDVWDTRLGDWLLDDVIQADRALLLTTRNLALGRALCDHILNLDLLPENESIQLLENFLGPLGDYHKDAIEIIDLMGQLPMALELAAKLCDNGIIDLPLLVRHLRDKPTLDILRLDGLEDRESSVEACLALSYNRLDSELQRRFRALGTFAPSTFDLAALGAVWQDKDLEETAQNARQLQRRGLLTRAEDRLPEEFHPFPHPVFIQHGLLRAYALALLGQSTEYFPARDKHADYFQNLTANDWKCGELFWKQTQHAWDWARGSSFDRGLKFYKSLRYFLDLRGRWKAHIDWVENLLQATDQSDMDPEDQADLLNNLGLVYAEVGDKRTALEYYEKAYPLMVQTGDIDGLATVLNNMAEVYDTLGDKPKALEYYNQALVQNKKIGDRDGEAATLNNIGLVYDSLGEDDKAFGYFQQALPIWQETGDRKGEATILNSLGAIYSDRNNAKKALEYYEQALKLRIQVGDRSGEAITLNNIGKVYSDIGDKQKALMYYQKALPLRRQVGNKAGEATTLINIGRIHYSQGNMEVALDHYEKALPLMQLVGNPWLMGKTYYYMGRAHEQINQLDKALAHYHQALPLQQQAGDLSDQAATLNKMGRIHSISEDKVKALEYYQQALSALQQAKDVRGEATTLFNIGRVYSAMGEKFQALENFKKALPLQRQIKDRDGEAGTLYNMAQVYEYFNQLEQAVSLMEQVVSIDLEIGHEDLESDQAELDRLRERARLGHS